MAAGDMDVYDIALLITGIIAAVMGIVQIYFLQTNVSRDNSMKIMLVNLSVADLMDGLIMIFTVTSKRVYPYVYTPQGIKYLTSCPKSWKIFHGIITELSTLHIFSVGLLTLIILTILKMVAVIWDHHFSKSTLKKVIMVVWSVSGICLIADFCLLKTGVYPQSSHLRYRLLWTTVLVVLTALTFFICYLKIYIHVCRANAAILDINGQHLPPYVSQTFGGKMAKIAILQFICFLVCQGPQQVVYILSFFMVIRIRLAWLTVLIHIHPILDQISLFIVYREELKKQIKAMFRRRLNTNRRLNHESIARRQKMIRETSERKSSLNKPKVNHDLPNLTAASTVTEKENQQPSVVRSTLTHEENAVTRGESTTLLEFFLRSLEANPEDIKDLEDMQKHFSEQTSSACSEKFAKSKIKKHLQRSLSECTPKSEKAKKFRRHSLPSYAEKTEKNQRRIIQLI